MWAHETYVAYEAYGAYVALRGLREPTWTYVVLSDFQAYEGCLPHLIFLRKCTIFGMYSVWRIRVKPVGCTARFFWEDTRRSVEV